MAFQLKKKTISILAIIFFVLSVGVSGYIMWRVEREEPVTPREGEAEDKLCISGAYLGGGKCSSGTWDPYRWCCIDKSIATTADKQCRTGATCPAAEYPKVAYCTDLWRCSSKLWSDPESGCKSNPKCSPADCPDGWESCGTSGGNGISAAGCVKKTNCVKSCEGCGNPSKTYRYCKPAEPKCGDGILGNTPGEECELGDPSGVIYKWDTCNQSTCSYIAPTCGDGIFGNTEGEECELGNPTGVSCEWDTCNQSTCSCQEPSCGDGIFGNTEGEECELGDPEGVSCQWDTCNKASCSCIEEEEPECGDGILGNTDGEQCEYGNPTGVSCTWDDCVKATCSCPEIPELPETGIFDPSSLAIAISVSMVVYGGVLGFVYYLQDSKDKKGNKILRRLGL
ncbi:MAG: hypothetical protein ABIC57_01065 [bacterium]